MMQNTLGRFMLLARRWWWLVLLGIVLCGGTTYVVSKLTRSVYQASAVLIVDFQTSPSSYDSVTAGTIAVPTYAQLVTSPTVLQPVLTLHPGMTLAQLEAMITVTPKPNTQLIEIDVENSNPKLAMNLANEISDAFVQYVNPQLTAAVFPVYAALPTSPVRPKPSQNAAIGALVGLGLALSLIFLFEWLDDRPDNLEEVQDVLGMEALATIPRLGRGPRGKAEEAPALTEACRMLCAGLSAAREIRPFKLLMVTSALDGEGKSTVAANLASFLALAGNRVLLVDADLRRPMQDRHFQLDKFMGLSHILAEAQVQPEMIESQSQATDIPTLYVLAAGVATSESAELLQSPQANQLFTYFGKAPFDYIVFDTPPLLPVADTQFLASHIHAAVLVVDPSKTPRKILLRAKRVLNRTRTRLLGVVINKCRWPEYGYIRDYQKDVPQANTRRAAAASRNGRASGGIRDYSIPNIALAGIDDIPTDILPSARGTKLPDTFSLDKGADLIIPETPPDVDQEINTIEINPRTQHKHEDQG